MFAILIIFDNCNIRKQAKRILKWRPVLTSSLILRHDLAAAMSEVLWSTQVHTIYPATTI